MTFTLASNSLSDGAECPMKHVFSSFGCTGGQHRSVYAADALARHLRNKFHVKVDLHHIEQEAKNWVN